MLDLSQNHFELFGLPARFPIDETALTDRYRNLQRELHPDRYAHASDQERRLAMQGATKVNEAHETLKDPLARARYLLELRGAPVEEGTAKMDPAFLMQQMELRETLAEAHGQSDPYAAVAALKQDIQGRIKDCVGELRNQFEASGDGQLDEARQTTHKLQFLRKLYSEADALEAELDETL